MRGLIILPPGQHRLEVATGLWLWEIYKPSNIPACVSRRAFYEAAHSCDGKSLLPPCQNEITRCRSPWPVFVGLSELVCVCEDIACLPLPSQRSRLFILIVSGRGCKRFRSIFNNKAGCKETLKSLRRTFKTNLMALTYYPIIGI